MKVSPTHTRIWVYLTERSDINDTTTKHSQHGNDIFPAWEQFIPNVGTISFFMLLASQNIYCTHFFVTLAVPNIQCTQQ